MPKETPFSFQKEPLAAEWMVDQKFSQPSLISLQANPHYRLLNDQRYEGILGLKIQSQQADKSAVEIELERAGICMLINALSDPLEALLYGPACNLLFGYAGANINELLSQAGGPPGYWAPLNFLDCHQRFCQNRALHPKSQQFFATQVQP